MTIYEKNRTKGKILVSACLMGERVRYDGKDKLVINPILQRWKEEGRLVLFCPEVEGGLPIPRPPAEIQGEGGGLAVLAGAAFIRTKDGADVTDNYRKGAEKALGTAQDNGCRYALVTDKSPSCGLKEIYNGRFSGALVKSQGVTTALLGRNGIKCFSAEEIEGSRRKSQRTNKARNRNLTDALTRITEAELVDRRR